MAAHIDLNPVRAGQNTMNTAEMLESKADGTVLKDLGMVKMLRCRVRYLTDGAVIGSKEFVNEAFAQARERFSAKRKDGALDEGQRQRREGTAVECQGRAGEGLTITCQTALSV